MNEISTIPLLKKDKIINEIIYRLEPLNEIKKIIIFGSFLKKDNPNDLDLAIFEESDSDYLTLSLKYRKLLRDINRTIPIDVLPVKSNATGIFLEEINKGKIIYEKRD